MLLEWQKGTIVDIQDAAGPSTKRFWIEIPAMDQFDFQPGQFVTLDLPIHEQKNKRWRSYSIASAPDGTNVIELVIVFLEGGAGTRYLFHDAGIGTELTLRGPLGKFTLPDSIEHDLFLICTGTGIAPFRSMAHHMHRHRIPHRDVHLIFGCRKFGDCLYQDELRKLAQAEERFFYHPSFSREEEVREGTYRGYVHQIYERLLQEEKKPAKFYLCGWKNMIDEAKQRILAMGYDKKDIHLELYG